jgi:hypothetical protein
MKKEIKKPQQNRYFLQAHFVSFCITILNIAAHLSSKTTLGASKWTY